MKKLITISGIVACAAIMFFNVSLNGKSSSSNVDLAALTKISEANAECMPYQVASGHCLVGAQICVFAVEYTECDPYQ